MADVTPQVVEPRHAALIANRIHCLGDPSSRDPRNPRGIIGVPSSRVLRGELQMRFELLFQVAIVSAWMEGSQQTPNQLTDAGHSHSPGSSFVVHQCVHDRRDAHTFRCFGGDPVMPGYRNVSRHLNDAVSSGRLGTREL